MEKSLFSIKAPIGNIVLPKDEMTERELRDFAITLAQDPTWEIKADTDPITDVVQWLEQLGYEIEKI